MKENKKAYNIMQISSSTISTNPTPKGSCTNPQMYIDLIGPITPIEFGAKRYFFMFTDDHTRITKTYTEKRKSEWIKSFQAFYNLVHIYIGLKWPIERL